MKKLKNTKLYVPLGMPMGGTTMVRVDNMEEVSSKLPSAEQMRMHMLSQALAIKTNGYAKPYVVLVEKEVMKEIFRKIARKVGGKPFDFKLLNIVLDSQSAAVFQFKIKE